MKQIEEEFYSTFPGAHPSVQKHQLHLQWDAKVDHTHTHQDYSFASAPHTSAGFGSFHSGETSTSGKIDRRTSFEVLSYAPHFHSSSSSSLSMAASSAPATTSHFNIETSKAFNPSWSYGSGSAGPSHSFHAPAPEPSVQLDNSFYGVQPSQQPLAPQPRQGTTGGTIRYQEPPMASLAPPRTGLQPLHSVHELYAASPTRTERSNASARSSYQHQRQTPPRQQQTQAFTSAPTPPNHYSPASSPYAPGESTFNHHPNSGTSTAAAASYGLTAPRDDSVPPSWFPNGDPAVAGGNTTRTVRSPSPAPEPIESNTNDKSGGKTAKKGDKKPPLACLFCRGRKIACGPPVPGGDEHTCNQCHRRSLTCKYPAESRRGLRRKRSESDSGESDGKQGKSTRSKR